jgi:hypothetical protein
MLYASARVKKTEKKMLPIEIGPTSNMFQWDSENSHSFNYNKGSQCRQVFFFSTIPEKERNELFLWIYLRYHKGSRQLLRNFLKDNFFSHQLFTPGRFSNLEQYAAESQTQPQVGAPLTHNLNSYRVIVKSWLRIESINFSKIFNCELF